MPSEVGGPAGGGGGGGDGGPSQPLLQGDCSNEQGSQHSLRAGLRQQKGQASCGRRRQHDAVAPLRCVAPVAEQASLPLLFARTSLPPRCVFIPQAAKVFANLTNSGIGSSTGGCAASVVFMLPSCLALGLVPLSSWCRPCAGFAHCTAPPLHPAHFCCSGHAHGRSHAGRGGGNGRDAGAGAVL